MLYFSILSVTLIGHTPKDPRERIAAITRNC